MKGQNCMYTTTLKIIKQGGGQRRAERDTDKQNGKLRNRKNHEDRKRTTLKDS